MKSISNITILTILFACYIRPGISLLAKIESASISPPSTLEISVYDVTINSVEIDWHFKQEEDVSSLTCELVYGPVEDASEVQVFTQLQLIDNPIIKLSHLENNVTYHMHMVCHNGTGVKIQSNALQFTTGPKTLPLNYMMPSVFFHSSIPRETTNSRDDDTSYRTVRPSSVILGAVCGIVGFLIINVTIVIAVRKYFHRQIRRRRIIVIEERDYEEFPYMRGEE